MCAADRSFRVLDRKCAAGNMCLTACIRRRRIGQTELEIVKHSAGGLKHGAGRRERIEGRERKRSGMHDAVARRDRIAGRPVDHVGLAVIAERSRRIGNERPRDPRHVRVRCRVAGSTRDNDTALDDTQPERMRQGRSRYVVCRVARDFKFRCFDIGRRHAEEACRAAERRAPIDIEMCLPRGQKRSGVTASDFEIREVGAVQTERDMVERKIVAAAAGDRTNEQAFDGTVRRDRCNEENRNDDSRNAQRELHDRAVVQQSTIGATEAERPACGRP